MRRKKLEMLRQTIELVSAEKLWKKLPVEKRTQIISGFTADQTKVHDISGSIEFQNFEQKIGKNWEQFIKAVLGTKHESLILTEEEVAAAHERRRRPPWDFTIRMVRGAALSHRKFLNVRHIPVGKIEVFVDQQERERAGY